MGDKLLSIEDAAEQLHVLQDTVLKWRRSGKLRGKKIGSKTVLIYQNSVNECLGAPVADSPPPITEAEAPRVSPEVQASQDAAAIKKAEAEGFEFDQRGMEALKKSSLEAAGLETIEAAQKVIDEAAQDAEGAVAQAADAARVPGLEKTIAKLEGRIEEEEQRQENERAAKQADRTARFVESKAYKGHFWDKKFRRWQEGDKPRPRYLRIAEGHYLDLQENKFIAVGELPEGADV